MVRALSLLALFAVLLGGCAAGGAGAPPPTGASGSGPAGAGAAAGAPPDAASAGQGGEAGVTGAAGESDAAAGSGGPAGAGVAGAAGTGAAGSVDASGAAGAAGADAGSEGKGMDAGAGAPARPSGPSEGCGSPPQASDSSNAFVKHDLDVTGVDPTFISAHPPDPAGGAYTWTRRNYYLRLPMNYDPSRPYLVSLGGTGCSGNDTVGSGGGYYLGQYVTAARPETIEISLSYVVYTNTGKPNCFADDWVNTPEPAYIDAILADVEKKYCVDRGKVFIHGHSSGAWEALTMGCRRADVLRGVATQVGGGLRMKRGACQTSPVAAIFVAGLQDTDNPIGPLAATDPKAIDLDSLGTAPARDDYLARNGCVGKTTAPWDPAFPACVKYTGCPASAPVVWCAINTGHNIGANAALRDQYAYNAVWKFWTSLP